MIIIMITKYNANCKGIKNTNKEDGKVLHIKVHLGKSLKLYDLNVEESNILKL